MQPERVCTWSHHEYTWYRGILLPPHCKITYHGPSLLSHPVAKSAPNISTIYSTITDLVFPTTNSYSGKSFLASFWTIMIYPYPEQSINISRLFFIWNRDFPPALSVFANFLYGIATFFHMESIFLFCTRATGDAVLAALRKTCACSHAVSTRNKRLRRAYHASHAEI